MNEDSDNRNNTQKRNKENQQQQQQKIDTDLPKNKKKTQTHTTPPPFKKSINKHQYQTNPERKSFSYLAGDASVCRIPLPEPPDVVLDVSHGGGTVLEARVPAEGPVAEHPQTS